MLLAVLLRLSTSLGRCLSRTRSGPRVTHSSSLGFLIMCPIRSLFGCTVQARRPSLSPPACPLSAPIYGRWREPTDRYVRCGNACRTCDIASNCLCFVFVHSIAFVCRTRMTLKCTPSQEPSLCKLEAVPTIASPITVAATCS